MPCGYSRKISDSLSRKDKEYLELCLIREIETFWLSEKHEIQPWLEGAFWKNVWKGIGAKTYTEENILESVNLILSKAKEWKVNKHPKAGKVGGWKIGDRVVSLNPVFDHKNKCTCYVDGMVGVVSSVFQDGHINVSDCFGGEADDFRELCLDDISRKYQTC